MFDIIALFFLCRKMGRLAMQKGLKPGLWKFYTVLSWLAAETIGVIMAVAIYGQNVLAKDNLTGVMLLALGCAFGGYLYIKWILEKKPDALDEEINSIGADELHPPRK